jgi:hypothetical protein
VPRVWILVIRNCEIGSAMAASVPQIVSRERLGAVRVQATSV